MNVLRTLAAWWRGWGRSSGHDARRTHGRTNRYIPQGESLEPRCLPATTIMAAFGAGAGGGPQVTVLFDDGSRMSFFAFDPAFTGGASVTTGQVNGTGVPDVIVGAGRGGGPAVKVFDGAQLVAGNVVTTADFLAFPSTFAGGVTVAVGHINNPTHEDVIVAAGPGGGSRVKVFDGADLAQGQAVPTADFTAFDAAFQGRVDLATGLVNDSRHADLVVAAGPGGGPNVKVFDGADLAKGQAVATANFFAFHPAFAGGVSLAAGNINGTGFRDVVVGAGPGGGPEVKVFDGADLAQGRAVTTADFFALDPAFAGGVQVAVAPLDNTNPNTVIVLAGPGGGPQVVVDNAASTVVNNFIPVPIFLPFFAFSPFFLGGFGYGGLFGYGNYFGYGNFLGLGGFGGFGTFSGLTPGFTGFDPAGLTAGFPSGGLTNGFSAGLRGASSGAFSGRFTDGGSSQRAAGGSPGVGGKAQGGGVYLAPGRLSLAGLLGNGDAAAGGTRESLAPAVAPGLFLTAPALRTASREALSWWEWAGINAGQDQLLHAIQFQIGNLGGDALARTTGDLVQLSTTAAGYGWFIDTPLTLRHGFGAATANGLAAGHMDLATVIAHEMGHVLGLKDNATPGDIMAMFLPAGTRRQPTALDLDAAFTPGAPSG
jgi:hypothetical protein